MAYPTYSSQTRFLTLNQPLPGEEEHRSDKRPERIYRAQKAPHWVVEEEEGRDEEPTFVDKIHGVGWEDEADEAQPMTKAGAAYEETLRQAQAQGDAMKEEVD